MGVANLGRSSEIIPKLVTRQGSLNLAFDHAKGTVDVVSPDAVSCAL